MRSSRDPASGPAGWAAAASLLHERLEGDFRPLESRHAREEAAHVLGEWREESGGDAPFREMLDAAGWHESEVAPLLGAVRRAESAPLPEWAEIAAAALAAVEGAPAGSLRAATAAAGLDAPPFAALLEGVSRVGGHRLRRRAGGRIHLLAPPALHAAERSLHGTLAAVSTATLAFHFHAFRAAREGALFRIIRRERGEVATRLYESFLDHLETGGLARMLDRYPGLARLWGTRVRQWVETLNELLERFEQDLPALQATVAPGGCRGPIVALRLQLSDRHGGGRTVMHLSLADGTQLIYKPRSVAMEGAYAKVAGWLLEQGAHALPRPLAVLERDGYGWAEFVPHAPLPHAASAADYYRRAGALLCAVHLLDGTDCHLENLVAGGDVPHLVDAETLMHPRMELWEDGPTTASSRAAARCRESVLTTGLLPTWEWPGAGNAYDVSGLGAFGAQWTGRSAPRLVRANSDDLAFESQPLRVHSAQNLPFLGERTFPAVDHEAALLSGFSATYRSCQTLASALLAPDGPLGDLAARRCRFLVRDTRVYNSLLHALRAPAALRDGIAQSRLLHQLGPPPAAGELNRCWRAVLRAEREALARGDVPRFEARVDAQGPALEGCDAGGATLFPESPLARVRRKLSTLDDEDHETQLRFIQSAFFSRRAPELHASATVRSHERPSETPGNVDFLAAAVRIGGVLEQEAIRGAAGDITWLGLEYGRASGRYRFRPVGHDLFSGRGGIALFLAALAAATGQTRWRPLALAALGETRLALAEAEAAEVDEATAGALTTLPYCLTRAAGWLADPALLADARRAARLAVRASTPEEVHDVLFGTAGLVLGLLALHRATEEADWLESARDCGKRLLEARTSAPTGHRVWPTPDGDLLTGFSHGAAGIALALERLSVATGDATFADAAEEALAFERALFDPLRQNWPDLRPVDGKPLADRFMCAWCHGATGIGLGRLGMWGHRRGPLMQAEVEVAISTTLAHGLADVDHLCCGTLGRAEFLLAAGTRLDRPDLAAHARDLAREVVTAAGEPAEYQLLRGLPRRLHTPGFFQGLAGVGYQFLRLTNPSLPVVLLME